MSPRRHHVVSVLVDSMAPLEPSVAGEVFGLDRSADLGVDWYRHTFCAEVPGVIRFDGGMAVVVDAGFAALRRADTVIVPGWCNSQVPPSPALLAALAAAHRRGARIVSFCTGAFALAAAGILDGRRATTHWGAAGRFRERFPQVDLDPTVLYVRDGNVFTSAGSAAALDLALHLVRSDHGAEVANLLARDLVVPPHRDGGQAQYIEAPVAVCPSDDPLAATLEWAVAHLGEPLPIDELAERSAMSVRNFTRRFRATTGTTPHQWLTVQRLAVAQALLETSDLPVDVIASRCGFGTAASLRLHFQRELRTTPQTYRRTFRCETAEAG